MRPSNVNCALVHHHNRMTGGCMPHMCGQGKDEPCRNFATYGYNGEWYCGLHWSEYVEPRPTPEADPGRTAA